MDTMMFNVTVQLIGFAGIIAGFISFQCRTHSKVMLFRTANELLFALQYFLLGAYTGVAMNIVGSTRNLIFAYEVGKGKRTVYSRIIFSVLFVLMGIFTWQGAKSIMIITAKILTTVSYGMRKLNIIRILSFVSCSCWLIYNIFIGSWAGIMCELITLVSVVTAIIRLDILKRNPKEIINPKLK